MTGSCARARSTQAAASPLASCHTPPPRSDSNAAQQVQGAFGRTVCDRCHLRPATSDRDATRVPVRLPEQTELDLSERTRPQTPEPRPENFQHVDGSCSDKAQPLSEMASRCAQYSSILQQVSW